MVFLAHKGRCYFSVANATSNHRPSSLNRSRFFCLRSASQEPGHIAHPVLYSWFQKAKRLGRTAFLSRDIGFEFTFKLAQDAVGIQFSVAVELRFPLLCSLLTGSLPSLLAAACISWVVAPFLHLQRRQWRIEFFSCFDCLWHPFGLIVPLLSSTT